MGYADLPVLRRYLAKNDEANRPTNMQPVDDNF
jgi:hypothetical protein